MHGAWDNNGCMNIMLREVGTISHRHFDHQDTDTNMLVERYDVILKILCNDYLLLAFTTNLKQIQDT